MNFFEEATLRLKQVLKLTEDQEVAASLGFAPNTWAMRKKRDSFPEKELYALAAKRPELGLDVSYVLTGASAAQRSAKPVVDFASIGGFDALSQVLRLKAMLGFETDAQIAELFGMSITALSERKKRNSFPKDRLYAIAAQRPELGLDVDWVLHGKHPSTTTTHHAAPALCCPGCGALLRLEPCEVQP